MFEYSMVKMIRNHAHKLDRPLRKRILELYKPLKWTPCFLQKIAERLIKKFNKVSVIVQFEEKDFDEGRDELADALVKLKADKIRDEFPLISCCVLEMNPDTLENVLDN